MEWSCNIAAILLFAFSAFGSDIGLVETQAAREARLGQEKAARAQAAAEEKRARELEEEKILDEARRKAQKSAAAREARDAVKIEREAIEAEITRAESLPTAERHKAAKVLMERVRQFLKTYGETGENLDWSENIRSKRLRPLSH